MEKGEHMDAIEKMKFFIENTDNDPKLPIEVGDSPESAYKVAVVLDDYKKCQEYFINRCSVNRDLSGTTEKSVLVSSVSAVRIRAQKEVSGLELFPCVSFDDAGTMRGLIEELLKGDDPLELIDCRIMSSLAYCVWMKAGVRSLPLIRRMIPLHASDVISIADELAIKI